MFPVHIFALIPKGLSSAFTRWNRGRSARTGQWWHSCDPVSLWLEQSKDEGNPGMISSACLLVSSCDQICVALHLHLNGSLSFLHLLFIYLFPLVIKAVYLCTFTSMIHFCLCILNTQSSGVRQLTVLILLKEFKVFVSSSGLDKAACSSKKFNSRTFGFTEDQRGSEVYLVFLIVCKAEEILFSVSL